MWKNILVLIILLSGSILIQPAFGKETIEILVPYSAGSTTDILSRLIVDIAHKYLDQEMVVVNKEGAGGSVAAAELISSKPGSKLFVVSQWFIATTTKTQKIPFEPNQLFPLANFMRYKHGLAVRGDSPWKTLDDMLNYAKKNPGMLKWGHFGRGTTVHMAGMMIFRKADVKTTDIPYTGVPELLASLLGGHVDTATLPFGVALQHVRTGKVRYVVTFSDRRFKETPDTPYAIEIGYPEASRFATDVGIYIHRDTPEEVKQTLIDALKKICEDPEFKKGFETLAEEPRCGGPEYIIEAIKRAEEIGVPVIKELGLYIEKK